jgi:hypothetical protein
MKSIVIIVFSGVALTVVTVMTGFLSISGPETHQGSYRPSMFRKRVFSAISAGLLPAESSQFTKSRTWTVCSISGCLIRTTIVERACPPS